MTEVKGEDTPLEKDEPLIVEPKAQGVEAAAALPASSPPTPAPSEKEDAAKAVQDQPAVEEVVQPPPPPSQQQQQQQQEEEEEAEQPQQQQQQQQERGPSPVMMAEGPDDLPIPTAIDPASPSAQEQPKTPVVEPASIEQDGDSFIDPKPLASVVPPEPKQEEAQPAEQVAAPAVAESSPPPPEPAPQPADVAAEEEEAGEAEEETPDDPMALKVLRRRYFSDDDEIDDELFSAERGLYSLSELAGARSSTELVLPLEGGTDEQLEAIRYDPVIPTFHKPDTNQEEEEEGEEGEAIPRKGQIIIKVPTLAQGFHHLSAKLPDLERTATPEPFQEIVIPTLGPIKEDAKGEQNAKIHDSIDAMMRIHRPDPNMIGRMRFDDEDLYGDDDDDDDYYDDYAGDANGGGDDDLDDILDDLDDKPKSKKQDAQDRKRTQSDTKLNPMFVTTLNTDLSDAERGIITYDDDELKKRQEDAGLKDIALDALESAQEIAEQAFGHTGAYAEKAGVVVAKALKVDDKIQNQSMFKWIGFGLVAAILLIVMLVVGLVLGSSKKAVVNTGDAE